MFKLATVVTTLAAATGASVLLAPTADAASFYTAETTHQLGRHQRLHSSHLSTPA